MKFNGIEISAAFLLTMAGCSAMNEKIIPITTQPRVEAPQPPMIVGQNDTSIERRFQEPGYNSENTLVTIAEWSKRYDELSKQLEVQREKNMNLTLEKNSLQQEIQSLKTQLQQAQREIEQSNLLIEQTHVELSKWKADVLGFREEIRLAQSAQLTALTRILRILGAETVGQTDAPTQEKK